MFSRAFLAVLFILAAGCTRAPPPSSEDEPAPTWQVGDTWTYAYSFTNATSSVEETWTLRVTDLREEGDERFHVVEETRERAGEAPVRSERLFATDTLWELHDVCGSGGWSRCRYYEEELNFPLWDGKRWLAHYGPNPVTYEAVADRTGEGKWRVTLRFGPVETIVLEYDAAIRNIVTRTEESENAFTGPGRSALRLRSCSLPACTPLAT